MLLGILKYYFNIGKDYQDAKVSYNRIMELLSIAKEGNGDIILDSVDEIETSSIGFVYPDSKSFHLFLENNRFVKGNIYLFKGDNGSGKSTIFNLLSGIIQNLNMGYIRISARDIRDIDMYDLRAKRISILLQQHKPESDLTVEEYLREALVDNNKNSLSAAIEEKSIDLIFADTLFEIKDFYSRKMHSLSGGEMQKVRITYTLLKSFDLLILDEPFTALDKKTCNNLIKYLEAIKLSNLILLSNHDNRLDNLADAIIRV